MWNSKKGWRSIDLQVSFFFFCGTHRHMRRRKTISFNGFFSGVEVYQVMKSLNQVQKSHSIVSKERLEKEPPGKSYVKMEFGVDVHSIVVIIISFPLSLRYLWLTKSPHDDNTCCHYSKWNMHT